MYELYSRIVSYLHSIGRFFSYLAAPRKLLEASFAARVAFFLALFLVLCVVATSIIWWISPSAESHKAGVIWVTLALLTFLIPWAAYYFIVEWLKPPITEFPEIDVAWRDGLAALEEKGISLRDMPLFLVLGPPDAIEMDSMMEAAGLSLLVKGVPAGRHPLRWYAGEFFDRKLDAHISYIFVALTGIGNLGYLNFVAKESPAIPGSDKLEEFPVGVGIRATLQAGAPIADSMRHQHVPAAPVTPQNIFQTLVPGSAPASSTPGAPHPSDAQGAASRIMTNAERAREARKVSYVGSLLFGARQPVCSLNGILAVTPVDVLKSAADEVQLSLNRDIEAIQSTALVFSPVTVLVSRMEKQWGFAELVRRIGAASAKGARFGKGIPPGTIPTAENLEAVAAQACGNFEDWVYSLFAKPGDFQRPGNSKLYTLLCHIRRTIQNPVKRALSDGLGAPTPTSLGAKYPRFVSGCYFAATGESEDQQAFVQSVFGKVLDLHEEVEWAPSAVATDERYYGLTKILMFVVSLEALFLIAVVCYFIFIVKKG